MIFNSDWWKHVHGYFDYDDVWCGMVDYCHDGDWIVELGSFIGRSSCCLGAIIQSSGKKINVLCVDPWPLMWTTDKRMTTEPFSLWRANIIQAGFEHFIFPLRTTSKIASTIVGNDLAAVYIDADHEYPSVVEDISIWLPKVRKGGILAGHDYSEAWPGVIQAVKEQLGTNYSVMRQSWVHRV